MTLVNQRRIDILANNMGLHFSMDLEGGRVDGWVGGWMGGWMGGCVGGFGLVYRGLTPQQQSGSYQGGEMMMKAVFWWRKPEYPEEPTDLRQVTDELNWMGGCVDGWVGGTSIARDGGGDREEGAGRKEEGGGSEGEMEKKERKMEMVEGSRRRGGKVMQLYSKNTLLAMSLEHRGLCWPIALLTFIHGDLGLGEGWQGTPLGPNRPANVSRLCLQQLGIVPVP